MQLSIPAQSGASRAATLLFAPEGIYGQYVADLAVSAGEKLSLTSADGTVVTSLPAIAAALFEAGGQTTALGQSEEEKVEVKSWLAKVGEGDLEIKALDSFLTSRSYLVGSKPTAADLSVFASLHPYIASATHTTLLSHPSVTRHFDHIQHLPLVSTVLARSTLFTPSTIPIDAANVPLVEIAPEVKVKKVKEGEAPVVPVKAVVEEVKKVEEGEKKPREKKVKADKPAGEKKAKAPVAAAVVETPAPWMVDLRVGKIIDVKLHPDADSLYVETIDVGEPEPRTVVSGLVNYIPIEQMRGKTLITVCNLKPANMRGVKSFAMVLCASSKDGKDGGIEFVEPPTGSLPGERVYFEGFESQTALDILNPKKKIFETVQPGFVTLDTKEAAWISEDKKVHKIVTAKGPCVAPTLVGASLS